MPYISVKNHRTSKKAERIVDFLKIYGISTSTFYEWKKEIQSKKGHQKKPRTINNKALLNDVKRFPDATQAERAARIGTTQSAICKALRRLKISRKKKHCTTLRRTNRKDRTLKKR
ncbi:IS630 transposase-related protein [Avibacterium sp. 21-599]|uniref:IS630 transposase-related protein n=1 Tax=Avibacterium sp. 21-599 TaxID=2911528 RepID=UPI003FA364BD